MSVSRPRFRSSWRKPSYPPPNLEPSLERRIASIPFNELGLHAAKSFSSVTACARPPDKKVFEEIAPLASRE